MALFLVAVIGTAQADFIEGKLAYEAGDYARARQVFQESIKGEKPDPDSLYHLAWIYENGLGVEANQTIALSYYQRAAKLDQAQAQFALGYIYSVGSELVPQDFQKAMEWYTKAADNGDKDASYNLGAWYLNGFAETKPNLALAKDWLQKGAGLGSAESIYALAAMYLDGNGVEKDSKKAIQLLVQADLMGYGEASSILGGLYQQGEQSVAKDPLLSYYYFLRAKSLGYADENVENSLILLKKQLPEKKIIEINTKVISEIEGFEFKPEK